jgi:hypothetical protein
MRLRRACQPLPTSFILARRNRRVRTLVLQLDVRSNTRLAATVSIAFDALLFKCADRAHIWVGIALAAAAADRTLARRLTISLIRVASALPALRRHARAPEMSAAEIGFATLLYSGPRARKTRLHAAVEGIAVGNVDDDLVVSLALLAGDPGIRASVLAAGCVLRIGIAWHQGQERES